MTITAALSFAQVIDSPVRLAQYNQIRWYRSTSETGTYSLIATSTLEFNNKNGLTNYNDTDGSTSSWYKFTYYNATSGIETAIADSIAVKGGATLYCTTEDVLTILNFSPDDVDLPLQTTILMIIEGRTRQFDRETNSTFILTDIGSTSDYQYIDGKGDDNNFYFLGKAPIQSVTALQTTQTTAGSTSSWDSLTSGRENDYVLDKDGGTIDIVDTALSPPAQPAAIRWYGTWGFNPTPEDVRNAIAKGVALDLADSNQYRNLIKGTGGFEVSRLEIWQMDWNRAVEIYKRDQIRLI